MIRKTWGTAMTVEKLRDSLTHARANYWILTVVCGAILALFLNELNQDVNPSYIMTYSISLAVGYYLSSELKKTIRTIKLELDNLIL
ncbi:hypothetical protein [Photobacterium sp. OFAV2-7]|uniref:hypothetical protein n=1 Tax=Photobacterium sp. OFAV2-7 TaxID=2917748 RepID=UPI001EF6950E|nr:hypothetical protein [Photobacterium sp. OFAV2-7]MCG7587595.1 hypothetical protein [Photobacterium sp. OFAV2-7]